MHPTWKNTADATPSHPVCSKWSSCTTEDKCQYEVETGRQCMKTFNQARCHKEGDCRTEPGIGNQPS